jgi:hypothetical protein
MTELRQRKPDVTKEGEAKNPSVGDTAERYVDAARTMAPELLQPYIKAMVPLARIIAEGVQASIPFLVEIHSMLLKLWAALKPYKPELLYPAFFGIVLCFFGGSFVTLIAAAEAYNMCSHETIMKCIHDLSVEFDAFLVHNKNDDKVSPSSATSQHRVSSLIFGVHVIGPPSMVVTLQTAFLFLFLSS